MKHLSLKELKALLERAVPHLQNMESILCDAWCRNVISAEDEALLKDIRKLLLDIRGEE